MDLKELRVKIDAIDSEITRLFQERMDVVTGVADYKRANNLPVLDAARERDKLNAIAESVRPEMETYIRSLYSMIFELSRNYQSELNRPKTLLHQQVENAIENTQRLFPTNAMIACQGVEGAYSQIAAGRLFKNPKIMYFKSFESVFSAIESGFCQYGVICTTVLHTRMIVPALTM